MTTEQFRDPDAIISDLLWFAEIDLDPADLEHSVKYNEVKDEAKAYLAKLKADRLAWSRIGELHKQTVRYDPGL